MPAFLENKLKAEYGADSAVPYKVMNKIGAMRGNKETAKGRAMEKKHDRKTNGGGLLKRLVTKSRKGRRPK